jgi:5-(aminomethyl)-3-furanmethanol phosphate kinase
VVKLGGSLARGGLLAGWLEALEHACAASPPARLSHLIVVPGGGMLADAVRSMQGELAFDDHTAHHMAMLAMEQFGLALANLWPRLTRAATLAGVRRAWHMQKVPWWAPTHMALAAAAPARSWDMTSDSLAAWLAGELKAERLLLIKSIDAVPPEPICADLAANGILDPLFCHFAAASGAEIFLAGPAALADAATIMASGGAPGVRIRLP